MRISGVGAYPEDSYYDEDRPSWLPFWIDTPTESDRKYHAANLIQATANAAGVATGAVVGTAANAVGGVASGLGGGLFGSLDMSGLLILAGGGFLAYKVLTR